MTVDDFADDVVRMTDDEIAGFLTSQSVGVLAIPTDGPPSMRPLSYWYDGESSLYFLYVVGSASRKAELTAGADRVRFLVYRAETRFNWRSVLLTGALDEVPETDVDAVLEEMDVGWRPDVFEDAGANTPYRFDVEDWSGVKHVGLPPGFDAQTA